MYHRIAIVIAVTLFLALPSLAQQETPWPTAVGAVNLVSVVSAPAGRQLDVGVAIFDPGIPPDKSTHSKLGIFPEIRKSEAQFMAVILRQVLVDSNAWGVVRVLPEPVDSAELLVTGEIIHSDGQTLVLQIEARDATGQLWLSQLYRDETGEADYPVGPDTDPFIDLYRTVANDLLALKKSRPSPELAKIRQVATLRYAASLSPEAFAGYLQLDAEGRYQLMRLPAEGDPMMDRVQRIRNQEFLFIDTVDENYADLYLQMAPTYHLWRQYGREQAIYREEYRDRVANRDSRGRRGSFAAMQQTYDAYKWSKIHEQDLDEMALGFNNEVTPTVLEVSGKLFRLNGTLDTQYNDWRDILRQIFTLETGLPPAVKQE
jgi:hypothetical protein